MPQFKHRHTSSIIEASKFFPGKPSMPQVFKRDGWYWVTLAPGGDAHRIKTGRWLVSHRNGRYAIMKDPEFRKTYTLIKD